jgi:hypothetical protein
MNISLSHYLFTILYKRTFLPVIVTTGVSLVLVSGCSTPTAPSLGEQLSAAIARGDSVAVAQLRWEELLAAVSSGSLDDIKLLLDQGADVNRQKSAIVITGVHLDSYNGQQVLQYQLSKWDGQGNNALSLAIIAKRLPVVRLLLERGADRNIGVIYRDADCVPGENISPEFLFERLNSGPSFTLSFRGQNSFLIVNEGKIITNIQPDGIKIASMKELAQMSGDKKIIELLSANSK